MKFRTHILLVLFFAFGLLCGCTKKHAEVDSPQIMYAKWNIAVNLHHWDEARKYVVPGSSADASIDLYIDTEKYRPIRNTGPIDKLASKLTCELHGDTAYVRWKDAKFPVFVMVKSNGKWLFKGSAKLDAQENPIAEP